MERETEDDLCERKRARNRRDYEKSKVTREHVLLRLDPGGSASLDAAARQAGLSRAAFARMFLPAMLDALGPRLAAIDASRVATGRGLARFLSEAIDEALARACSAPPSAHTVADEFDDLFG